VSGAGGGGASSAGGGGGGGAGGNSVPSGNPLMLVFLVQGIFMTSRLSNAPASYSDVFGGFSIFNLEVVPACVYNHDVRVILFLNFSHLSFFFFANCYMITFFIPLPFADGTTILGERFRHGLRSKETSLTTFSATKPKPPS
jgi:hypothetical protein